MARAGRWIAALIILFVATILAIASLTAVFVRNQLLNTDRYVATVAPLANDPVIQDAIARRLTNEVIARVDLPGLAEEATAFLARQGAPERLSTLVPAAVNAVENFLYSQIREFVGTEQFANVWRSANRVAHDQFNNVLTGQQGGIVGSSGTAVYVDVGVLLGEIKQRLVARGFTLAERIPQVEVKFTLFESPELPKIRVYVRWLNVAATWLPWITLILFVCAVAVAPNRRRGALVAGFFIAIGGLVALGALSVARVYYLDRLPPTVQSPQAAEHVFDALIRRPTLAFQIVAGIGLAIVLVTWLAGPGLIPRKLRSGTGYLLDLPARALRRRGVPSRRIAAPVANHRRAIEFGLIAVAALIIVLAFFDPTVTLWTAVLLVVLLAAVEIVARTEQADMRPA